VIVIDPRNIQMARNADLHLPFRPGADVAVLNGLMNVIISEGLEDKAFITERTEAYDEMKAVVEKYTPQRVEEISGIRLKSCARLRACMPRTDRPPLCMPWESRNTRPHGQCQVGGQPGHADAAT